MDKRDLKFPEKCEELAELLGIMLGDGNMFSLNRAGVALNYIRVLGNSMTERKYMFDFVKPLIESLFWVRVSTYVNDEHEIFLTAHGKSIVEFMQNVGLVCGDKIKARATIPAWILKNKWYLKACVRGLIDTDGSIYPLKPPYPNLLQICFKNKNPRLLQDVRKSLVKLGYHPSKITWNKVYLTRQAEIDKYVDDIGFNNSHHQERYLRVREQARVFN